MKNKYQVIVGNIGTVCTTHNLNAAAGVYQTYVKMSQSECGRASLEPVILTRNDEAIKEWIPIIDETN